MRWPGRQFLGRVSRAEAAGSGGRGLHPRRAEDFSRGPGSEGGDPAAGGDAGNLARGVTWRRG